MLVPLPTLQSLTAWARMRVLPLLRHESLASPSLGLVVHEWKRPGWRGRGCRRGRGLSRTTPARARDSFKAAVSAFFRLGIQRSLNNSFLSIIFEHIIIHFRTFSALDKTVLPKSILCFCRERSGCSQRGQGHKALGSGFCSSRGWHVTGSEPGHPSHLRGYCPCQLTRLRWADPLQRPSAPSSPAPRSP